MRRMPLQTQNEAGFPKRTLHWLPMPNETKQPQLQIRHQKQKMGKTHNQNKTPPQIQRSTLRRRSRRANRGRANLVLC